MQSKLSRDCATYAESERDALLLLNAKLLERDTVLFERVGQTDLVDRSDHAGRHAQAHVFSKLRNEETLVLKITIKLVVRLIVRVANAVTVLMSNARNCATTSHRNLFFS